MCVTNPLTSFLTIIFQNHSSTVLFLNLGSEQEMFPRLSTISQNFDILETLFYKSSQCIGNYNKKCDLLICIRKWKAFHQRTS